MYPFGGTRKIGFFWRNGRILFLLAEWEKLVPSGSMGKFCSFWRNGRILFLLAEWENFVPSDGMGEKFTVSSPMFNLFFVLSATRHKVHKTHSFPLLVCPRSFFLFTPPPKIYFPLLRRAEFSVNSWIQICPSYPFLPILLSFKHFFLNFLRSQLPSPFHKAMILLEYVRTGPPEMKGRGGFFQCASSTHIYLL